ncbi:glycoside hydrolase family 19 protein [Mycolicibacterium llatzerense]|uniref:glycoside hydrolase family 19 protein n=1 Tax=Mycolicibacterium llatzerense TaxID=280871 RepID=UPI0021B6D3C4|nr:M15 family metallopeptidase [Mycolicibacterium llatzerense]
MWVTVPGASPTVSLQLQKGQPAAIMRAYAADYNEFVEPLRDADSASWTPTNSVATSNHLGGTAMDLNWNSHPFRIADAGYTPQMIATMRELLDFYEGTMFWSNDWDDPKDAMHHQMGYDTYGNPHTADFIARKIRPDGYSTFRRGDEVSTDIVGVLAVATGLDTGRAATILPQVRDGLAASQCTTPRRIAMWLAQIGHESDRFNATEEYSNGDGGVTERWLYKGRTWIQITWKSNYAGFSKWAYDNGFLRSPNYFVDHPSDLADMEWAGLGPAWYWTVARPQINTLCDQGDINEVTRLINGGYNGLDDRTARYQRALALGDQLLQLLTEGDDFMPALTDDEQHELLDLARQQAKYRRPSLSPLRWPHEGDVNTCAGFAWATDGNLHVMLVEKLAVDYGDAPAIALLYAVAHTDEPGRDSDKVLANKILAKVAPADITAAQGQIKSWLDAEAAHHAA